MNSSSDLKRFKLRSGTKEGRDIHELTVSYGEGDNQTHIAFDCLTGNNKDADHLLKITQLGMVIMDRNEMKRNGLDITLTDLGGNKTVEFYRQYSPEIEEFVETFKYIQLSKGIFISDDMAIGLKEINRSEPQKPINCPKR